VITRPTSRQATPGGQRFAYTIGFIFCVMFPAFVTLIAPVSTLTLSWDGEQVEASTTRFVYLVVPYATTTLSDVRSADTALRPAHTEPEPGRSSSTTVEGEAHLQLSGPQGQLTIPISPINVESAQRSVEAFLAQPNRAGLRLLAVANWKFSVIAGGLLSLLTLLYVVGCVLALGRWLVRIVRTGPSRQSHATRSGRRQRRKETAKPPSQMHG
jgi:hypothetical protein